MINWARISIKVGLFGRNKTWVELGIQGFVV